MKFTIQIAATESLHPSNTTILLNQVQQWPYCLLRSCWNGRNNLIDSRSLYVGTIVLLFECYAFHSELHKKYKIFVFRELIAICFLYVSVL